MKNSNSAIIYRGPSMLDGQPIVAIVSGIKQGSANSKTGAMLQTWILRHDVAPIEATRNGDDASICGDCVHRANPETGKRSCYVTLAHAPRAVWKAYRAGRYSRRCSDRGRAAIGAGRKVRLGSYGDPAAVPIEVWESLTRHAIGWSGYTHQWRRAEALEFRRYVMASADSHAERERAQSAGWRTFRVSAPGTLDAAPGEILCPASEVAGKKTTCERCRLCMGSSSKARVSIFIPAHGGGAGNFQNAA